MPDLEINDITPSPSEASEPSVGESLAAAFDAAETEPTTPNDGGSGEPKEPKARVRDEAGRFAKEEAKKEEAAKLAEPKDKVEPAKAAPVTEQPKPSRAPQSWKPDAREVWDKLPPEAQREILRREGEQARFVREHAEDRRIAQTYRQAVGPYEQQIRSEGGDPGAVIGNLLQTAAALRNPDPRMRAKVIAGVIGQFLPGREGLEILDQTLAGTAQPGAAQPQQFRDPRLDQLIEQSKQAEAQRRQRLLDEQYDALEAFGKDHEFFEDVRQDMADLMEMAARRRLKMTYDEAYNRAVRQNPEIWKVLEGRAAAKKAAESATSTSRARVAASSIRSKPAGSSAAPQQTNDLRSLLEQGFNG